MRSNENSREVDCLCLLWTPVLRPRGHHECSFSEIGLRERVIEPRFVELRNADSNCSKYTVLTLTIESNLVVFLDGVLNI